MGPGFFFLFSQLFCLLMGPVSPLTFKIIIDSDVLLRNLYAGQETTVRTGHGTTDWFQRGKEYAKAVYCHPVYLTYMQSTS